MDFSVLNESSLHNTLKKLYAFQNNGQMEVEQDGHVYDILTDDNTVIEIQTKNLAKLLPKLLDALEKGHKIKLVHPLVIEKTIEMYDSENKLISKRKSPVKGSIYDLFRELTGIYPVLLEKEFCLEVLEITMTEKRIKTDDKVQSKNNRRRFKKDWNKADKKLNEILEIKNFNSSADYINLLPTNIPEQFCAKDLRKTLRQNKNLPASAAKNANLIIWVLAKMNLITFIEINNKSRFYKINPSI